MMASSRVRPAAAGATSALNRSNSFSGVVQNEPFLGYTGERKPAAFRVRVSVAALSG